MLTQCPLGDWACCDDCRTCPLAEPFKDQVQASAQVAQWGPSYVDFALNLPNDAVQRPTPVHNHLICVPKATGKLTLGTAEQTWSVTIMQARLTTPLRRTAQSNQHTCQAGVCGGMGDMHADSGACWSA